MLHYTGKGHEGYEPLGSQPLKCWWTYPAGGTLPSHTRMLKAVQLGLTLEGMSTTCVHKVIYYFPRGAVKRHLWAVLFSTWQIMSVVIPWRRSLIQGGPAAARAAAEAPSATSPALLMLKLPDCSTQ